MLATQIPSVINQQGVCNCSRDFFGFNFVAKLDQRCSAENVHTIISSKNRNHDPFYGQKMNDLVILKDQFPGK